MKPGTPVQFRIKNVTFGGVVGSLAFNISSVCLYTVVLNDPLPSGELTVIMPESMLEIPFWVEGL